MSSYEHKILFADSTKMKEIQSNSIQFIVTSPPYWNLKNYGGKQIGFSQAYKSYLLDISKSIAEISRVIEKWRYICINVGTAVSNKGMKSIPGDVIRIAKDYELLFRKEIIWKKPKGVQGLWQRGTTQFLKDTPYPTFLNLNILHETILIFQKTPDLLVPSRDELIEYFNQKGLLTKLNKIDERSIKKWAWSVWEMSVSKVKGHPAPFPVELPLNLIKLYSFPNETVLDPFLGSGTTTLASILSRRNSIGYEINTKYYKIIRRQINIKEISNSGISYVPSLVDKIKVSFLERKNGELQPFTQKKNIKSEGKSTKGTKGMKKTKRTKSNLHIYF